MLVHLFHLQQSLFLLLLFQQDPNLITIAATPEHLEVVVTKAHLGLQVVLGDDCGSIITW